MKRIDKLKKALIGTCLLAVGLSGQTWAAVPCSSSTEGNDLSVGTVGGSASCEAWGMSGCFVRNPGGSCTALGPDGVALFTVNTDEVNSDGEVSWSIEYESGKTSDDIGAIDVSIWEGAKKGQNYPFLFRYDVGSPDGVSMTCNDGATAGIHFCMDQMVELAPEALILENPDQKEVGFNCIGETVTIYGVEIDVSAVPAGQGDTTITVARSERQCDPFPNDVPDVYEGLPACVTSASVSDDGHYWEPDPSFGFAEDGQISLKNVCIASGGTFDQRPQCDPDPEIVNGPFIDSLPECLPRAEGIIREEVSVGYQGSGYVGYGGSRRYY
jgi:hypothetical protein